MTAPKRYCLTVCYCRQCPHYKAFELNLDCVLQLVNYLAHPPRKYSARWWRDPGCRGERN